MTTTRTVKVDAVDPRLGMSLDELAAFVDEARQENMPGNTVVKVRVNVRGGIKRLETKP